MMNKILLLGLLLTPTLWAKDASEEAIILNQELQFLEDAANGVTVEARAEVSPQQRETRPTEADSLERQYFGGETEDTIRSRTSAPKRRSF